MNRANCMVDVRVRYGVSGFRGFTLVEVLVATAVLLIVSLTLLTVVDATRRIWRETTSRAEQFREARRAFDRIAHRISQATLNPYWDYVNSSGQPRTTTNAATFVPAGYSRQSELRFIQVPASSLSAPRGGQMHGVAMFFQVPAGEARNTALDGMDTLLNTVGFFLENGSDATLLPNTIQPSAARTRFRLFELVEPSENLTVYSLTSGNALYGGDDWFTGPLSRTQYSHLLAENIVALTFVAIYLDRNGNRVENHFYSSAPSLTMPQPIEANNLPPNVRVTMVAVDEVSAARIQRQNLSLPVVNLEDDIPVLESYLISQGLNFQKFQGVVKIGAAQWITE